MILILSSYWSESASVPLMAIIPYIDEATKPSAPILIKMRAKIV